MGWGVVDGWKACTGVWVKPGEGGPICEVVGTSQGSC